MGSTLAGSLARGVAGGRQLQREDAERARQQANEDEERKLRIDSMKQILLDRTAKQHAAGIRPGTAPEDLGGLSVMGDTSGAIPGVGLAAELAQRMANKGPDGERFVQFAPDAYMDTRAPWLKEYEERNRKREGYRAIGMDERQIAALDLDPSLLDNFLAPSRSQTPTDGAQRHARVIELLKEGKSLAEANRTARLEFGLTPGDGSRSSRDETPEGQARRDFPFFNIEARDAARDLREEQRATPLRSEYEVQDREDAFPADSAAHAARLSAARAADSTAHAQRDSVARVATGRPIPRVATPRIPHVRGLDPRTAQAMQGEFDEAARTYQALVAKGVDEARARRAYEQRLASIAARYGVAGGGQ